MSLEDLLKRVESCSGPDRALDAAIRDALYAPEHRGAWLPYTSSLDAALALVREKLPNAEFQISYITGEWWANVDGLSWNHRDVPALALLAALLRALSNGSKEGENV